MRSSNASARSSTNRALTPISAPDAPPGLHHALELAPLQVLGHRVGKHVEFRHRRAAEAALRREAELLERDVARRFIDSSFQVIEGFDGGSLGADQPEKGARALAKVLERGEIAGAWRVVLE